jgi:hypothetical protein
MKILAFWNMALWVLFCKYLTGKIDESIFRLFHGKMERASFSETLTHMAS